MGESLAFDVETDGLLPPAVQRRMTRLHCLSTAPLDSEEAPVVYHDDPDIPREGDLRAGFARLSAASLIVGHNSRAFDVPAIQQVSPQWCPPRQVHDTLVMGRLAAPDVRAGDFQRLDRGFPKQLIGRHSLEAWGWRIGVHKGEFAHEAGSDPSKWDTLTADMADYCRQDVNVCRQLYARLSESLDDRALTLEHEFADSIHAQVVNGVGFDMDAAEELAGVLSARRAVVRDGLTSVLGDRVVEWVTPKRQLPRRRVEPVNPSSRPQLVEKLQELYKWRPTAYTDCGSPKLDERVVAAMDPEQVPIRDLILEWFLLEKRLGQLAEGSRAWMKVAVPALDGGYRIHGYVNHNGARTGRCTHSRPNVAQVPRVGSPYGAECRGLFVPRPGWCMVGADLAGIEARVLAHFLHPLDGGSFASRVQKGDFHAGNAERMGVSRQTAKTLLYAVMFGAGPARIARVLSEGEGRGRVSTKAGNAARESIMDAIPGLASLITRIKARLKERGHLVGLDGRHLRPGKDNSALNTIIQAGGAVVMKRATVVRDERLAHLGEASWRPMIHCHDEYQVECEPYLVHGVAKDLVGSMEQAGRDLGLRVPITGESKIGYTWADTH